MSVAIVEGMDATGKSTLVKEIASIAGLRVVNSGGPPSNLNDLVRWCRLQAAEVASGDCILDRCSAISQRCYNFDLDSWTVRFLEDQTNLLLEEAKLVYCRPPTDDVLSMSNHVIKSTDTPELLTFIDKHKSSILREYDLIMHDLPHIHYDYTVSNSKALIDTLDL